MSRELRADELKEALELAENFHDGTDYNFDRLTPDEQEVIVDAARRLLDFDAREGAMKLRVQVFDPNRSRDWVTVDEGNIGLLLTYLQEQNVGEVMSDIGDRYGRPFLRLKKPGRYLVVPLDTEPPKETTHKVPEPDSGIVPCCGRTPFELPRLDRMTLDDDLVTCAEPPKETE